ncbi:uncharacterized protein A4U43_C01F35180 [Asparagus officinalis]|uniref:FHA domain-containing protein n=1 Tax=Asparagus officinalis TaxID=4686 RepID=A0A5P1FUU4_ASPOF|nr:nuclear inhibitor of protein phosphatase 1 [Asparagus officinalis]XP_020240801.1 nuclear inhibitor of protein phosphatase 1 [Asparagus officinalis]ONK82008.1 uncharacterized protein A4U43_C01F35180 [Asparagus officinalis]
MYRGGLDRFKKAQSLEPFSVSNNSASKTNSAPKTDTQPPVKSLKHQNPQNAAQRPAVPEPAVPPQHVTQLGGGQSTWQPPDWAIEPRAGVYYLEVVKDGEVLDRINLDKRRHIFGRQIPTCDFVLDHQSVSRQHAAVVPHKNGSIFVIDLGSVHGTFVANERLTKDSPVELEVGQSLKFAASTRSYVLRKNTAALFPTPSLPSELNLPSPPDPSDEDAVVAYNTILNRYGVSKSENNKIERPTKKRKRIRVAFKDQVGGSLVEVVGISDGADIETEPGPIGVKEGSLVGKYESLIQTTVIPKGKEQVLPKEDSVSPKGVTDKLQQVFKKVKNNPKGGIYDDLYGDSFKVGSSWAKTLEGKSDKGLDSGTEKVDANILDDSDDLFG